MKIAPFATEQFFARYEFSTPYQLCNSDCETISVEELLRLAKLPLEELGRLSLGYTESLGHPQLRQEIAASYAGIGMEDVVMLGAPIEGIHLVAQAVLEPGDGVIVLSPAYDALINQFEYIVGPQNVRKWTFTPGAIHWELDFDRLEGLLTPQTRLLVVNFPHNPTGFLPTPDQMDRLVQIVEQHNLLLFCDEMYFGLWLSGAPSIRSAAELTRRAIVLCGLSKTYGLPGLRTGWLVIRDAELRQRIINWKFYTSICASAPSEFLALAAWRVRDQLRAGSIRRIEQNLRLAEEFFQRWPNLFRWRRPLAGSVALVGVNVASVTRLAAELAEKAGVLILPAISLGWDDQHMRMGFGRAAFGSALEKFEEYLKTKIK